MPPIRVVVHGASGRMGREVLSALCKAPDLEPAGAVSRSATEGYLSLPDGSGLIPYSADLEGLLPRVRPHVVVDFTVASAALQAARTAAGHRVHFVTGASGLPSETFEEMDRLARQAGVGMVAAPNFALGAVILMYLARMAAPYFDYAEIVELHHEAKLDAPSGTALATARAMAEARGRPFTQARTETVTLPHTRGGSERGIPIHSLRLPGLMAHQEVILGAPGQTLTLRHDTINRECYMPGVVLAIQKVGQVQGLVVGLEPLLGLT